MKTVLIIDDSANLSELTSEFLEAKGYQTVLAYDGDSGLEMARVNKPDIILLDLVMPNMDGYEVCSHLKEDSLTKEIPVVMVTSRSEETYRKSGAEVGVNDFLTKPFEFEDLLDTIEKFI